jgi:hypothetical protein
MGEEAVMRRPPTVMTVVGLAAALALALALWAWLPTDDEVVAVASGKANATPGLPSAGSSASLGWRTPTTAPPVPLSALASATTAFGVPITVAAPQQLQVGEMNELVVGMGRNGGVGEVSVTVKFDPNVLQARVGTEGDWVAGAGLDARSFAAEISDAGDHVLIRSAVSGQRLGMAGGSVAIVQFQAVGPGTTSVLITDVVLKDFAGRSVASAVPAAQLQMTVESLPPKQPEAGRHGRAVAVEPPVETTEDGD